MTKAAPRPARPRALIAALLCLAGAPALAQSAAQSPAPAAEPRSPSPAQAAQQQRMRDCNAEATEKHLAGDPRRAFMSECLAGRPHPAAAPAPATPTPAPGQPPAAAAAHPLTPQQERMRDCNARAGERSLAGDARRHFMSECLAGHAPQ